MSSPMLKPLTLIFPTTHVQHQTQIRKVEFGRAECNTVTQLVRGHTRAPAQVSQNQTLNCCYYNELSGAFCVC